MSKSFPLCGKFLAAMLSCAVFGLMSAERACGSADEASDKAYAMAAKYSALGYYMAPSKEGWSGFGVTIEFTMEVSKGLDYVFILGGDKYLLDPDCWIESESGNTIVKDTRKYDNGMCGVRWRSDYSGTVNVVVHFARATSRFAWSALIGRRGTAINRLPIEAGSAPPGGAYREPNKAPNPINGPE